MDISEQLAKYTISLNYRDFSSEVVEQAKRVMLDTLGCAIGGYNSEASKIVQEVVKELGGPEESTIIGSGLRTSCLNAALVNGVMVRYLDYNDAYIVVIRGMISGSHPSEVIPAVLALGEREHCSGKEVIEAIVLGYELSARFSEGPVNIPMENRGWNLDTRGTYIMPLVAGKILRLNEDQLVNAVGISGSHNMVLGILDAPGEEYTMTKNLRFPRTAYGGIMAALLAQKGFTGPCRVIEGNQGFIQTVMTGDFDVARLLRAGERFKIMDTVFKAFSTDATMHGHLTATLTLVREHDIEPEDVEKIHIWAGTRDVAHTGDLAKRYPKNKESADHSTYYCTAIAILERAVSPAQFTPEKFEHPKVRELIDKITFEADTELDYFGGAGIVEIQTKQGTKYRYRVDYPKGHPRNPMSDEEIEEKFRGMASEFMDEKQIKDVITIIQQLEELDGIGELMKALVFK